MGLPTRGDITRTYDAIAESFDRARERPWPEVAEFAATFPPSTIVLDLGCGNGRHAKALCDAGHRVLGIDASRGLLPIDRRREPRAALVQGDVCGLPFRDRTFSSAIAVATIHHLPSDAERLLAIREMYRVLTIGGRALVSAWAFEQARFGKDLDVRAASDPREATDVWIPWRGGGATVDRFYHLFRDGELRDLILKSGLRLERYFRSGDNDFVVAERDG
ncbi:MAG: methyltransferase domain-containing protein [Candidatus Thermoplasmatota archaeon]